MRGTVPRLFRCSTPSDLNWEKTVALQPLICPNCGSTNLETPSRDMYKCRNCGTVSRLVNNRLQIEIVSDLCPFCGNPAGSGKHCKNCGKYVYTRCAFCQAESRLPAKFCEKCGADLGDGPPFVTWKQDISQLPWPKGKEPKGSEVARVARIAVGDYSRVFNECVSAVRDARIAPPPNASLPLKPGLTVQNADATSGIITCTLSYALSWPRNYTVNVYVQPTGAAYRGVAVVCVATGKALSFSNELAPVAIANALLWAIVARVKVHGM